jgi:hypothetical protein
MRVPGNSVIPTIRALQTAMDKATTSKEVGSVSRELKPASQDPGVQISGRALVRQRLFDLIGTDELDAPRSAPLQAPSLTPQDKQLLGDIYEWAREQGAELGYVDNLGRELAGYRSGAAAKAGVAAGASDGVQVDPKQKAASRLTTREEAAIKRMLTSDALKTTRLDAGFIRHATTHPQAGRSPYQLDFMEKVVERFSTSGDKPTPLGSIFSGPVGKSRTPALAGKPDAAAQTDTVSAAKRKPFTLESLREARVQGAMKALGVTSLSALWDNLLSGSRFRR